MPPRKRGKPTFTTSNLMHVVHRQSPTPSGSNSGSHSPLPHSKAEKEQSRSPSRERRSGNSRQEHEESQRTAGQAGQDEVTSSAHEYTQLRTDTTRPARAPVASLLVENPPGQTSSKSRSSHQSYADNSRAPPPGYPEYTADSGYPAPGYSGSGYSGSGYPGPGYSGSGYSGYPGRPENPEHSIRSGNPVSSNPLHSIPRIRPQSSDFTGAPSIAQPNPTPDRSYQPTHPPGAPIPSQQSGSYSAYPYDPITSERPPPQDPNVLPRERHVEPPQSRRHEEPPVRGYTTSAVPHAGVVEHGLMPSGRPPRPGGIFPVPNLPQRQRAAAPRVLGRQDHNRIDPSQSRYPDNIKRRREKEEKAEKFMEEWNTLPPETIAKQLASDREKREQEDEKRSREKQERVKERTRIYEENRLPRSRRPRRREERSESRSRRLSGEDQDEEERRKSDRKGQRKEKSDKKKR